MQSLEIAHVLADLACKVAAATEQRVKDLLTSISTYVELGKAVPRDLQDQYVKYLANNQRVDRYGK